jgi:hypothetical protein
MSTSIFHIYGPLGLQATCITQDNLLIFIFVVLWLELRAYILSRFTSSISVKGFFEIGSHKLFAQAGFQT